MSYRWQMGFTKLQYIDLDIFHVPINIYHVQKVCIKSQKLNVLWILLLLASVCWGRFYDRKKWKKYAKSHHIQWVSIACCQCILRIKKVGIVSGGLICTNTNWRKMIWIDNYSTICGKQIKMLHNFDHFPNRIPHHTTSFITT